MRRPFAVRAAAYPAAGDGTPDVKISASAKKKKFGRVQG
jgi:hypothetical protein